MKKALLAVLVVAMIFGFASGAAADQLNYGCGLGTMILGSTDTLALQIAASLLNMFLLNQPFAITSGTSNCEKPEGLVREEKIHQFVADNMDHLARDVAQGQGEYIGTLAALLEVPQDQQPAFYANLQSHFSQIYPSAEVTSDQVVENIRAVL